MSCKGLPWQTRLLPPTGHPCGVASKCDTCLWMNRLHMRDPVPDAGLGSNHRVHPICPIQQGAYGVPINVARVLPAMVRKASPQSFGP